MRWFVALFFDVRDRLDDRPWITEHVLAPAVSRLKAQQYGWLLMWMGYHGGAAFIAPTIATYVLPSWALPLVGALSDDTSVQFVALMAASLETHGDLSTDALYRFESLLRSIRQASQPDLKAEEAGCPADLLSTPVDELLQGGDAAAQTTVEGGAGREVG